MQTHATWHPVMFGKQAAALGGSEHLLDPVGGRVAVALEVPEFWFTVAADGDRHMRMFSELCAGLGRRSVTANLSIVPFGTHLAPRTAPRGGICISYHSVGDGDNIWRIKETPIVGWYSFDRNGFSGWSSLARFPERHAAAIDATDTASAQRNVAVLRDKLRTRNLSKYAQSNEPFNVDRPFVYFPLQLLDDPVAQFCRIDTIEVLKYVAMLADQSGQLLVVKRHPLCESRIVAETLAHLSATHQNVMISGASIHEHLPRCSAVVVANSGVGLEALLYGKPAFTFAASEYELGAYPCGSLNDLSGAFGALPGDDGRGARFLSYYLTHCCFSIDDRATIDRCVEQALSDVMRQVPAVFTEGRDEMLRGYAKAEMLRRELDQVKAELARVRVERPANPGFDISHSSDSAAQTAMTVHAGGLSASVAENIITRTARAAFTSYAELAVTMRSQSNPDLVDAQLLHSAYASGLDRNVAVRNVTADDYQRLHNFDAGYQNNNWLVDHSAIIASACSGTIIEVGCGNGRFLHEIAGSVRNVIGLDWARSPLLGQLPVNVAFQTTNVLTDNLPKGGLCCSADVLEHFEAKALPGLLRKLHESAPINYHVIACYDDGHSHCSVLHPGQWLGLFKSIDPSYQIAAVIPRRGRPDQIVCVITNLEKAADHFPFLGVVVGTWQTNTGQRVAFGNDFTVRIDSEIVASWFPMPDGTAAVGWMKTNMIDIIKPAQNGEVLEVKNIKGEHYHVRRVN